MYKNEWKSMQITSKASCTQRGIREENIYRNLVEKDKNNKLGEKQKESIRSTNEERLSRLSVDNKLQRKHSKC